MSSAEKGKKDIKPIDQIQPIG